MLFKNKNLKQSNNDKYFGWHDYETVQIPEFEKLSLELTHSSGPTEVLSIETIAEDIKVTWNAVMASGNHWLDIVYFFQTVQGSGITPFILATQIYRNIVLRHKI